MHWMPMLAEAYILNKVREAQEERIRQKKERESQSPFEKTPEINE